MNIPIFLRNRSFSGYFRSFCLHPSPYFSFLDERKVTKENQEFLNSLRSNSRNSLSINHKKAVEKLISTAFL